MKNFNFLIYNSKKFSNDTSKDIFGSLKSLKSGNSNNEINMGIRLNSDTPSSNENYQRYMKLITGNKEYVAEKMKENPDYFRNLAKTQTPKYLLIGCSDSRVPPNEITKTNPGEIFIHRNIANQVNHSDLNCMSVIQYAVENLGINHIIVMGHTHCGGIKAANEKKYLGLIQQWLTPIKDMAIQNKDELLNQTDKVDFIERLTEINVKMQCLNVCKTPFVQKAWKEGRDIHVSGWLMDIETGLIKDLTITNKEWNDIKSVYDYNF